MQPKNLFPWILFLCLPMAPAAAHPEGFSGLQVTLGADRIQAALTLHTRDLGSWFPPGNYPDYVADVCREMEKLIDEIVEVQIDGQPLVVDSSKAFLLEVGLIEIDIEFVMPPSSSQIELLVWSKHLIYLPRGHQQLLFIVDKRESSSATEPGIVRLEETLSVDRDAGAILLPPLLQPVATTALKPNAVQAVESNQRKPKSLAASERPSSRISFYFFGIKHILSGYDHLLFLGALLLACANFREAATIITCFTVAHSITLALAALDFVRLSGSIVEPAIALTIVYVALENLIGMHRLKHRVAITCFFGLIHGLGFASALRDIGLGTVPGGVLWPLFEFNLGVETGQLLVAGITFPLILYGRQTERRKVIILRVGSTLVALFGAYWFVTRIAAQLMSG